MQATHFNMIDIMIDIPRFCSPIHSDLTLSAIRFNSQLGASKTTTVSEITSTYPKTFHRVKPATCTPY